MKKLLLVFALVATSFANAQFKDYMTTYDINISTDPLTSDNWLVYKGHYHFIMQNKYENYEAFKKECTRILTFYGQDFNNPVYDDSRGDCSDFFTEYVRTPNDLVYSVLVGDCEVNKMFKAKNGDTFLIHCEHEQNSIQYIPKAIMDKEVAKLKTVKKPIVKKHK